MNIFVLTGNNNLRKIRKNQLRYVLGSFTNKHKKQILVYASLQNNIQVPLPLFKERRPVTGTKDLGDLFVFIFAPEKFMRGSLCRYSDNFVPFRYRRWKCSTLRDALRRSSRDRNRVRGHPSLFNVVPKQ